jgi:hypothetical protein
MDSGPTELLINGANGAKRWPLILVAAMPVPLYVWNLYLAMWCGLLALAGHPWWTYVTQIAFIAAVVWLCGLQAYLLRWTIRVRPIPNDRYSRVLILHVRLMLALAMGAWFPAFLINSLLSTDSPADDIPDAEPIRLAPENPWLTAGLIVLAVVAALALLRGAGKATRRACNLDPESSEE